MLIYKEPKIEDTKGAIVIYNKDYRVLQYIKLDDNIINLINSISDTSGEGIMIDTMQFMQSLGINLKFNYDDYYTYDYFDFNDKFTCECLERYAIINFYLLNEETKFLMTKYVPEKALRDAINRAIDTLKESKEYVKLVSARLFPPVPIDDLRENRIREQNEIIESLQIIAKETNMNINIPEEYLI